MSTPSLSVVQVCRSCLQALFTKPVSRPVLHFGNPRDPTRLRPGHGRAADSPSERGMDRRRLGSAVRPPGGRSFGLSATAFPRRGAFSLRPAVQEGQPACSKPADRLRVAESGRAGAAGEGVLGGGCRPDAMPPRRRWLGSWSASRAGSRRCYGQRRRGGGDETSTHKFPDREHPFLEIPYFLEHLVLEAVEPGVHPPHRVEVEPDGCAPHEDHNPDEYFGRLHVVLPQARLRPAAAATSMVAQRRGERP